MPGTDYADTNKLDIMKETGNTDMMVPCETCLLLAQLEDIVLSKETLLVYVTD